MHETDMTKALIFTVKDWLAEQPGHPAVEKVHLTVGAFTCVEPAGTAVCVYRADARYFFE